MVITCTNVCI